MQEQAQCYLSQDAISNLFGLKDSISDIDISKAISVDFNLQVGNIVYYSAMNESFYSLCDLTHCYPYFIIDNNSSQGVKRAVLPKHNDIIRVQLISSYYDSQHQAKVFAIHSFKRVGNVPFSPFALTKEYKQEGAYSDRVYLRNEPFAEHCNLISHLFSLPTNVTLFIKVLAKTSLITYKNNKGMLFFFDVIDQEKTRLRVVAFNSNAKLYSSQIKINAFYQIKGSFAKQKSSFRSDDLLEEIHLSNESEIREMTPVNRIKLHSNSDYDDEGQDSLEFNTIRFSLSASPFLLVNIIGKVIRVSKVFNSKANGSVFGLKIIKICDSSGYKIDVHLWNHYTLYLIKEKDIVALYNVQIKQYEAKKILSTVNETKIAVNPRNKEAIAISSFLNNFKGVHKERLMALDDYSALRISQLVENYNGNGRTHSNFKVKVIVTSVLHSSKNYYEGCADLSCKGRVLLNNTLSFMWQCSKCAKRSVSVNYYYTLRVIIQDCSGSTEAVLANSAGFELLGINAFQYKEMLETDKEFILTVLSERIKYEPMYFYGCSKGNTTGSFSLEIAKIEKVNQLNESRMQVNKLQSLILSTNDDSFLLK